MKDIIKLLILLIPVIKDLLGTVDDEVTFGKKKRILKIMENQDLTRIEKLERILFRKGKVKVEIYGYIKNDIISTNEKIKSGVIVNERFIESYFRMADQLKKKD